jgi:hypothetical protein
MLSQLQQNITSVTLDSRAIVRRPSEVGTPLIRNQAGFMQSREWQDLHVSIAFFRQYHLNKRAASCCVKSLLVTVQ